MENESSQMKLKPEIAKKLEELRVAINQFSNADKKTKAHYVNERTEIKLNTILSLAQFFIMERNCNLDNIKEIIKQCVLPNKDRFSYDALNLRTAEWMRNFVKLSVELSKESLKKSRY